MVPRYNPKRNRAILIISITFDCMANVCELIPNTTLKIKTKACPMRYPSKSPSMAILKERKLNLLKNRSKPNRIIEKIAPIVKPMKASMVTFPIVVPIMYVVIKKTLKIKKRIRVKISEIFILNLF